MGAVTISLLIIFVIAFLLTRAESEPVEVISPEKGRSVERRPRLPASAIAPIRPSDVLELPQQPSEIDKEYEATSRSDPGAIYRFHPQAMTCTCRDFVRWRAAYAGRDIRRVCKHLARFYAGTSVTECHEALQKAILTEAARGGGVPHTLFREAFESGKGAMVLGHSPGWTMIQVFLLRSQLLAKKRRTERFAFDLSIGAWVNGPPDGAGEIRRRIVDCFGV